MLKLWVIVSCQWCWESNLDLVEEQTVFLLSLLSSSCVFVFVCVCGWEVRGGLRTLQVKILDQVWGHKEL